MALLPLETWRLLLGWNGWHFWGLSDPQYTPLVAACPDLLYKYAWQGTGQGSREDITQAIEEAERKFRWYMNFRPAPEYTTDEVGFPAYYLTGTTWLSRAAIDGRYPSVTLPEGYVQAIGTERLTLIGNATLAYTDADGDGLDDTFTATIATTETDPDKIAVYFRDTDRWDDSPVGADWRIEPVRVTISGGNATIVGRRWQVVKPVLYESQPQEVPLDPTDNATFVTQLAIYQRTTDPTGTTATTSQVMFSWEGIPSDWWYGLCCGNVDNGSDPAAVGTVAGRGGVRNSRLGIVSVGSSVYNSDSSTWVSAPWGSCRTPDRVTVRYLAGYPLVNGQMQKDYARVLAMLSAAELPNPPCKDDAARARMHHWQFDLSRAAGEMEEQYSISQEDLNNPFGTRRGQVLAWKHLKLDDNKVGRGHTA